MCVAILLDYLDKYTQQRRMTPFVILYPAHANPFIKDGNLKTKETHENQQHIMKESHIRDN